MLKYISYALLLTTIQANLNVLPKMFRTHVRNKELLNYDSSELSKSNPFSVTKNPHSNEMIQQNKQIIEQSNQVLPQNKQILPDVVQINKIQQNNTKQDNENNLIKRKLFKLVKAAKIDVDRKMTTIDKVHDDYKNKRLYKIGYIVSFLNKTYEELSDAYKFVNDNKHDWDVLTILNSYEKVKRGNDFVSELLNILRKVLKDRQNQKKTRGQSSNVSATNRIAWNYYDDS